MRVKDSLAVRQAEHRYLEPARRTLGADAERQFEEGRRLTFEDAVAEALGMRAE
jgi:hypothetical protein